MRIFLTLLLTLALAACEYHMQPEVRGAELNAMMERHIAFIAENSGFEPFPPPRVEFQEDLMSYVRAKWGDGFDEYAKEAGATDVAGFYEYGTGTVHLPVHWKPYVEEEAALVHELVHYLQVMNRAPYCRREWEQ